jgi:hypothetical protein
MASLDSWGGLDELLARSKNPHVGPGGKIIPSSGAVRADDAGILDHLGLDTLGRDES